MKMPGAGLSEFVVEVLCQHRGKWSVGSGYLVAGASVLTAAHNVNVAGRTLVRFAGGEKVLASLCGDESGWVAHDPDLDLAVLALSSRRVDTPQVRYAEVERDPAPNTPNVDGCWAFGFPKFRERENPSGPGPALRDNVRLDGYIAVGQGWVSGRQTFKVTDTPRSLPSTSGAASEWAGISGAVVFAGDLAVGVITQHHLPEGESALTVVPLTAIDGLPEAEQQHWWQALGGVRSDLPTLPGEVPSRWSATLPIRPRALVARAEQYAALRAALLEETPRGPVVVTGMAGAGKSVLAAEAARRVTPGPDADPALARQFADGVVWVRVGTRRPSGAKQRELAEALGSENPPLEADVDAWRGHLQRLTQGRHGLVVLDDVRELADYRALAPDQPGIRVLVTTLDRTLATSLGVEPLVVGELERTEGRALLARLVNVPMEELPEQAEQLLAQVGDLALGVAMVGSLAGDLLGQSGATDASTVWNGLLRRLREAHFERLSGALAGYEHTDLAAAVMVCVEDLPPGASDRWAELSASPASTAWPTSALEDLWARAGLDELDTRVMLRTFDRRSLVQRDDAMRFFLHDLQLAVAQHRLQSRRAEVHGRLLDRWRERFAAAGARAAEASFADLAVEWAGREPEAPVRSALDDGYRLQTLAFHLVEAGVAEELHELLARGTETGVNAWYDLLRRRGLRSQFLADVTRARSAIDGETAEAAGLAMTLRYSLYEASLRTSAARLQPAVLEGLLRHGLVGFSEVHADLALEPETEALAAKFAHLAGWFPEQGKQIIASVRGLQDAAVRRTAIVEVAACLDANEATALLPLAQDLPDAGSRARALAALAVARPRSPETAELAHAALTELDHSADPGLSCDTLKALRPLATGAGLQELARRHLAAAWQIPNSLTRSTELGEASVSLLRAGLVEEARTSLRHGPPKPGLVIRNWILDRILPELPPSDIHRLRTKIHGVATPSLEELRSLALMLPRLESAEQQESFDWLVASLESLEAGDQGNLLEPLVRNAPPSELGRLLSWSGAAREPTKVELCARLCDVSDFDQALGLAESIESASGTVRCLVALAERQHPDRASLVERAVGSLADLDEPWLATTLDELVPLLDADQTIRVAHLLATNENDDPELDLLLRASLARPGAEVGDVAEDAWAQAVRAAEQSGQIPLTVCAAVGLLATAGCLGARPEIALVLPAMADTADAQFWHVPVHLQWAISEDRVAETVTSVTELRDEAAIEAGLEALAPALSAEQAERAFLWAVRLPHGRLLGRVATALKTDRTRLSRLVAPISDVRVLVDAWASAFSAAAARDIFEGRLHQLLVEEHVDWRELDGVAASNLAEPIARWARDDFNGVFAKVPRPASDTFAERPSHAAVTIASAVVVAAPDEPAPTRLLRELAAALDPLEALGALTAAIDLGEAAPGLLAVAGDLVPAVRDALDRGQWVPGTLPRALGGLAGLASDGAQQEEYARLALETAVRQPTRHERTMAFARLARILPTATLPRLAEAIRRSDEDPAFGSRTKAAAVASLGERLATEGQVDEALALVDLVGDPAQRYFAAHQILGSLPLGTEVDHAWLTRPGRRTRGQWLADLAALCSLQEGDLPANEIVLASSDCLRWWP